LVNLSSAPHKLTWTEALSLYSKRPVLIMLALGFFAGLPYLLVFSTLTAWLRDEGISRSAIGFISWVGITYSIKVFWAPIVDNLPLPILTHLLGKRRSWLLIAQVGIVVGILLIATVSPVDHMALIALCALFIAFSSATQDIVIDAYRIETAVIEFQGAMAATYSFGYRLALLVSGAGSLFIADTLHWPGAYLSMAGLMGTGIIFTLCIQEPGTHQANGNQVELFTVKWFYCAVVAPFVDFFQRNGRFALLILAFIGLFRLSDITMGVMANPFYLDLGFTKTQIASISKIYGFAMTIAGGFIAGICVAKLGVYRPLIAGAILVAVTNLLYAQLAQLGAVPEFLIVTISADNLSGGFSNAAFIAYLSGLTNRAYTATQYALFSSFMTLPGKFQSGFSGVIVDNFGYWNFFIYAAIMGIPAILLAIIIWKHQKKQGG